MIAWLRSLWRRHEPDDDQLLERFVRCPHCNSEKFLEGPSGGCSVNVFCANEDCRAGFNVFMVPGGPFLDREIQPPKSSRRDHSGSYPGNDYESPESYLG